MTRGPSDTSRHRSRQQTGPVWDEIRELRREVSELRRGNELGGPRRPAPSGQRRPRAGAHPARPVGSRRAVPSRRAPRRRRLVVAAGLVAILVVAVSGVFGGSGSFPVPSSASLAGLSVRQRIVAIAVSQVGYATTPSHSYCNKFSAYWGAGAAQCPGGESSEEWCADFAAWAWQKAGVRFTYGFGPAEINARAASFYQWGVANGDWHPAASGYRARPGDVAVYGLSLGAYTTAAHVAIVTGDSPRRRGPDVVNGDGDRTGFSVVETGTNQVLADAGHHGHAVLDGYVSPP